MSFAGRQLFRLSIAKRATRTLTLSFTGAARAVPFVRTETSAAESSHSSSRSVAPAATFAPDASPPAVRLYLGVTALVSVSYMETFA